MINNIQALRALAVLLVMAVHCEALVKPLGLGLRDLHFGGVGVHLFFVISGFVMVDTTLRRRVPAGDFLLNRVIRIVPFYWLATLTVSALALAAPHLLQSTSLHPGELLKSLAFVAFLKSNGRVEPVLFTGWTLNYEVLFYLLFAIALAATRTTGRTVALISGTLAAIVLIGAAFPNLGPVTSFYTAPLLLEFMLGTWIAWAVHRGRFPGRGAGVVLLLAGLVLLIVPPIVMRAPPLWMVAGPASAAVLLGAVAIERAGLVASWRMLQLMGGASYVLYLIHPFVLQAMAKMNRAASPSRATILIVVGLIVAQAIALGLHLLIELPMTRALRRLVGHAAPVVVEEELQIVRQELAPPSSTSPAAVS